MVIEDGSLYCWNIIYNLEDIALRVIRVLRKIDIIYLLRYLLRY